MDYWIYEFIIWTYLRSWIPLFTKVWRLWTHKQAYDREQPLQTFSWYKRWHATHVAIMKGHDKAHKATRTMEFQKYARQIGSSPQVGVKINGKWNHHLAEGFVVSPFAQVDHLPWKTKPYSLGITAFSLSYKHHLSTLPFWAFSLMECRWSSSPLVLQKKHPTLNGDFGEGFHCEYITYITAGFWQPRNVCTSITYI